MANKYFSNLNYSLGDEDSVIEVNALPRGTDHVVAIAGSGGRVVPLLGREPRRLTCVDISDAQLALTELRVAALKVLAREEYLGFLGYTSMSAEERARLFDTLQVSDAARVALQPLRAAIAAGRPIIYEGRFERMLRTLSRVNGLLTRARGRGLFDSLALETQRRYVETRFPSRAWRLVLALLGNSTVLNSLLYRGDFPKKNRPGSTYKIYREIFERLFRTVLARRSFFLQMVFFGELVYADGFPIECSEEAYPTAQRAARASKIDFVRDDILQYVQQSSEVGFVSLSDVPSFLPPRREQGFLAAMKPGLAAGALVATRGHLRVITPNPGGFDVVTDEFGEAIAQESTQLWKVDIYRKHGSRRAPGAAPGRDQPRN
jgi:S-adenosylmethionine-diacylglycerol 3-amino-3-carboxypropyl transferase